jgi:hypothetical protein
MEAGGQPARTSGGQWHNSAASTLTVPAMAKKADKQQASALDEVRRHVRIFVDLGRVASESTDEDGSERIASSSAPIDFLRPTKSGAIMCGNTTMSRSGNTG